MRLWWRTNSILAGFGATLRPGIGPGFSLMGALLANERLHIESFVVGSHGDCGSKIKKDISICRNS